MQKLLITGSSGFIGQYLLNSSEKDLKNITGWSPTVSLTDGVKQTIEIWKNK